MPFHPRDYQEALQKKKEREEKRRNKPKSEAAKAWKKRSNKRKAEKAKSEAEWKQAVRKRYDYTCQFPGCRYRDEHIHCHHIAPRSQRRDLIYDITNGICLCSKHHDWVHSYPLQAVDMGLLSKESREWAMKGEDVLPFPGWDT